MSVNTTDHATGRDRLMGHLAMLGFAVLLGGSFSFGKLATPYIDPAPLNAARFVIGSTVMGFIAFGLRRNALRIPVAPWRFVVLGGCLAIYFVSMFMALTITAPISTSAVFTLIPIMSAVFGFFLLKQIVRPAVALSLVVAGFGAVWVIFNGDLDAILNFRIGKGELIYFVGCVFHALYAPLVRLFNRGEPVTVTTFFVLALTALWIIVYGFGDILATDWAGLPPVVWWVIGFLSIFASVMTFFLLQIGSLRLPASKVLAYGYLVPVSVILLEGLSGNGWASLSVMAGAGVTVLGLLLLYLMPDK